jgi:hypothetical protein
MVVAAGRRSARSFLWPNFAVSLCLFVAWNLWRLLLDLRTPPRAWNDFSRSPYYQPYLYYAAMAGIQLFLWFALHRSRERRSRLWASLIGAGVAIHVSVLLFVAGTLGRTLSRVTLAVMLYTAVSHLAHGI